ncbi:hypothetical protein BGZ76_005638, partial [Entomortierella beljakovae]
MDHIHANQSNNSFEESVDAIADALRLQLVTLEFDSIEAGSADHGQDGMNLEDFHVDDSSVYSQLVENDIDEELQERTAGDAITPIAETPLDALSLERQREESAIRITKESLLFDPFIDDALRVFGIQDDNRIKIDEKGRLVFFLREIHFDEWLDRYQDYICNDFNSNGRPYVYSAK